MSKESFDKLVEEAKRYNLLVAMPKEELAERFSRLVTLLKGYESSNNTVKIDGQELDNLLVLSERSMLLEKGL